MSTRTIEEAVSTKRPAAKPLVFDADSPLCRELGICSTCNHRSSCLFLRSARQPIAYCEEFDGTTTETARPAAPRVKRLAEVNYGQAQDEGVCVTCQHRPSCVYRQPGLAIWDCQDFS